MLLSFRGPGSVLSQVPKGGHLGHPSSLIVLTSPGTWATRHAELTAVKSRGRFQWYEDCHGESAKRLHFAALRVAET